MSGFLLLVLALLCIAMIESGEDLRAAPALLVATVPLVAAANPWNLPLQGLLVGAWLVYRLVKRESMPWAPMVMGSGAASLLVLPFLSYFTSSANASGCNCVWCPAPSTLPHPLADRLVPVSFVAGRGRSLCGNCRASLVCVLDRDVVVCRVLLRRRPVRVSVQSFQFDSEMVALGHGGDDGQPRAAEPDRRRARLSPVGGPSRSSPSGESP